MSLKKLETKNIRSEDLITGDAINAYLSGAISKIELKCLLSNRRKEVINIIKGIDKLLNILRKCPSNVEMDNI